MTWITIHLLISEGWKAELAYLADIVDSLPKSGQLSTIHRAQVRESLLVKDQLPNH